MEMATGKKTRPVIGKLVTTGDRSGAMDSPRSPFDLQIVSPRGLVMSCEVGGVGLGIVAALEKSEVEVEDDEEYTIVTRHMPNKTYKKGYDGDQGCIRKTGMEKEMGGGGKGKQCLFDISPAPAIGSLGCCCYQPPDFLTCCHHCSKQLDGKDIYMYRGEKAFCSMECRCREIRMEERREKQSCSSSACSHGQMFSTGIFAI